eukprot:XP_019925340.1 PREDICTED: uncharacterized protein LOC109619535 [Crassostrea gigas]
MMLMDMIMMENWNVGQTSSRTQSYLLVPMCQFLHGQETLKAVTVRPSTHPVGYWVCFFKKATTTKKPLLKLEEKGFFFVFPNDLTREIKEPRLEAFGSRIYYNFSD